jgi:hypothetical protein
LVTDHKALEEKRNKPDFKNARVQRWIEEIQEYGFTIEYQPGPKLADADELSRLYEDKKKQTCRKQEPETKQKKRELEERAEVRKGGIYWKSRWNRKDGARGEQTERDSVESTHAGSSWRNEQDILQKKRKVLLAVFER